VIPKVLNDMQMALNVTDVGWEQSYITLAITEVETLALTGVKTIAE